MLGDQRLGSGVAGATGCVRPGRGASAASARASTLPVPSAQLADETIRAGTWRPAARRAAPQDVVLAGPVVGDQEARPGGRRGSPSTAPSLADRRELAECASRSRDSDAHAAQLDLRSVRPRIGGWRPPGSGAIAL